MNDRRDIQAIVFDLDDTLHSERAYAQSGFAAVAEVYRSRLGEPADTVRDMLRLLDAGHRRRVFDALLADRGLPQDDRLIANMAAIQLYPDVKSILDELTGDYRLGLITDGWSDTQWAKIDALGLRERFDHIIVTDDLGEVYRKPHPESFERTAAALDVSHSSCAYVADNVAKDFIAPNSLGWLTVRVVRADGIYAAEAVADGGEPQFTIRSLDELRRLLRESA